MSRLISRAEERRQFQRIMKGLTPPAPKSNPAPTYKPVNLDELRNASFAPMASGANDADAAKCMAALWKLCIDRLISLYGSVLYVREEETKKGGAV